jgi:hypothetical protein
MPLPPATPSTAPPQSQGPGQSVLGFLGLGLNPKTLITGFRAKASTSRPCHPRPHLQGPTSAASKLAALVDWLGDNLFPYYSGLPLSCAGAFVLGLRVPCAGLRHTRRHCSGRVCERSNCPPAQGLAATATALSAQSLAGALHAAHCTACAACPVLLQQGKVLPHSQLHRPQT